MIGRYCYPYPHPAVTTDVVLLTIRADSLQVLLIRRDQDPFVGHWALPGGFLEPDEDLDSCAARELEEETGLAGLQLEQFRAFSRPDRDPRERVVSVAYIGLTPSPEIEMRAASDAAEAAWHPVTARPALAFDHDEIIDLACHRLLAGPRFPEWAFGLVPEEFTLDELKHVHEVLFGRAVSQPVLLRWLRRQGRFEETGATRVAGSGRAAALYRFEPSHGQGALARSGVTS